MDRRSFVWGLAGTAALTLPMFEFGRQAIRASAAGDFSGLGLPEATITVTEAGYGISPATTPAGWTLLTLDNQLGAGDTSADVMLIPPGESIEALLAAADPAAPPPEWIFAATFAGAPWVPAGASGQALVLLSAGEWGIFSPSPLAPAALTVAAGDAGTAAPSLAPDVELTMQDFAFLGLEAGVRAGPQTWLITNAGPQPHLMTINQLPDGMTQSQFMDEMAAMMPGPPGADSSDLEPMAAVGGCATLSVDQSLYLALDLTPGTYGAICFFPDQETGAPHAMMGMAQVFSVGS